MKDLVTTYIVNQSVHWFIVGLFFPIMILFLLDKGMDIFEAGTAIAAYSGTVLLLELPTGGLSDSIGRKRVYLASLTVQLASAATLLVAWNYPGLLLGVIGLGIARALSSGTIDAWFVDEFNLDHPGGDLQKAIAKTQVFIPIGIALGSLVGGLIPMTLGKALAASFGTGIYSATLITMIAVLLMQFMLTSAIIVERTGHGRTGGAIAGLKRFPEVLSTSLKYGVRNRIVLLLMLASLGLGFGVASVELLWQPRAKDLLGPDSGTWVFGVLAAAYFVAMSAGNVLITPLCQRLATSYARVLLGLRALVGLILVILAMQDAFLGFTFFFLLAVMVNGMSGSPHVAIFNSQVPSERRSTMMSFESLVLQGGGMIGSITLGGLAQDYSIPAAWYVAGAALVISSGAYLALVLMKVDLGRKQGCAPVRNLIADESIG